MNSTKISTGNPLDGYFPKEPTESQRKRFANIWFRVCVSQIPPRDSQFDFQLDMGRNLIEKVLHHTAFANNGTLFFCFPERWLSQKEQYYFVPLLTKHPSIVKADMTQIDMITMSPLIVTNLWNEDCRCLTLKKHVEGLDKKTHDVIAKLNLDGYDED